MGLADLALAGEDLGSDSAGAEDVEEVDGAEVVLVHQESKGIERGGGWGLDGAVFVFLAEVAEEGLHLKLFRVKGA